MHGVEEITATKQEARAKYKEYRAALVAHPLPYVRELKDAYNQLRRGHGVIDVFKAFRNAGVNSDGEPRLAIWPADGEGNVARFEKLTRGAGRFQIEYRSYLRNATVLAFPEQTFPDWATKTENWGSHAAPSYLKVIIRERITAPLPIVPPHLLPRAELSNFHILWEVEKWNLDAPRDPLLLRRISTNLFAVVARWDLTELERAVIAGRIR